MSFDIQLAGAIKLGATGTVASMTDCSLDVSKLVLHASVNKVARKPTYGDPRMYSKPGARVDTIEIVTDHTFNASSGAFNILMTAFFTPGKLVYFTAKYDTAATSATNQAFGGSFMVDGLDFGDAVNDIREFSRTFDLVSLTGPLITDPTVVT